MSDCVLLNMRDFACDVILQLVHYIVMCSSIV